jgi:allophanate hydrolase
MSPGKIDRESLHAAYAAGMSPVAVVELALSRHAAANDPGLFIHLREQAALQADAAALPPFDPARYPLWGLPCAVKDNIDVAGSPTTAACPAFAYAPETDAPVVARLKAAGALVLGKTNLDQFATGLVGARTPYPIPRNPFDAARVPGGSSSGSAVAVARGIATFALGTDTAGSGRIPAAFNNIVGLKPSLGALSTRGVVPACRTLDCVSIFATTVADAEAVFTVAAGHDQADPYSRAVAQVGGTIRSIGVPMGDDRAFFGDVAAARAYGAAVDALAGTGVDVRPVDFGPFLETARMLYAGPWVAERRAAVGAFMDANADAMHPVTRGILAGAERFSAVDAFRAFYRLAELRRAGEAILATVDALCVPTAPIFPTLADLAADPLGPNTRLGTYTNFVNLMDLAALAVPGPFRSDGLPAGITLIAPAGHDLSLARLGARFFPGVGGHVLAARTAAA